MHDHITLTLAGGFEERQPETDVIVCVDHESMTLRVLTKRQTKILGRKTLKY